LPLLKNRKMKSGIYKQLYQRVFANIVVKWRAWLPYHLAAIFIWSTHNALHLWYRKGWHLKNSKICENRGFHDWRLMNFSKELECIRRWSFNHIDKKRINILMFHKILKEINLAYIKWLPEQSLRSAFSETTKKKKR
jgi:hypothetical protein